MLCSTSAAAADASSAIGRELSAEIHGCDLDAGAIAWCRANLGFARFEVNAAQPPLPYDDGSFDLVCGLSVFTHLPEPAGLRWMAELARVLRPGGRLVLSTHGPSYRGRLYRDERARFDAGELIVRWPEGAGTNLCSAWHPRRTHVTAWRPPEGWSTRRSWPKARAATRTRTCTSSARRA